VTSGGMMFIPSFTKIFQFVQKLLGEKQEHVEKMTPYICFPNKIKERGYPYTVLFCWVSEKVVYYYYAGPAFLLFG
jgi:hypothetical protein